MRRQCITVLLLLLMALVLTGSAVLAEGGPPGDVPVEVSEAEDNKLPDSDPFADILLVGEANVQLVSEC